MKGGFYFSINSTMLTVGVNACYKSSITKLNQVIFSLFNSEMTMERFEFIDECQRLWRTYSSDCYYEQNIDLIQLAEDVEILIALDGDNMPIYQALTSLKQRLLDVYKSHLSIRIVRVFQPHGVSYARNLILTNATGKYVKFCDDDDLSVNINELIEIIVEANGSNEANEETDNADYIECCMTNLTKNKQCPIYTGWFPSNVIVRSDWIRQHKLYFVNDIVGEDSIWRFDLFHQIHLDAKVKVIERSIYLIYFKSFKTTNDDDDDRYDQMLNNVFNHEIETFGKIPMNPALFEMVSSLVYGKSYPMKVSDWMLRYPDKFEFADLLRDITKLHNVIDNESWRFAPIGDKILKIVESYYGTRDVTLASKLSKRYMIMKDGLTDKNSPFMQIYNRFIDTFSSPHYFKTYVHMMKKRDSCWMKPKQQNIRFHNIIEDINEPVIKWSLKIEQIEYITTNSIRDNINYEDRKFSFVPFSCFLWCWLNSTTDAEDDNIKSDVDIGDNDSDASNDILTDDSDISSIANVELIDTTHNVDEVNTNVEDEINTNDDTTIKSEYQTYRLVTQIIWALMLVEIMIITTIN